MSKELKELVDLLEPLADLAAKKFAYNQGLLAAIFIADALKAGGFPKDQLQLGTINIEVHKDHVGSALQDIWTESFGDSDTGRITHHVLLVSDIVVDAVVEYLDTRQSTRIFVGDQRKYHGDITAQPIYRSENS